MKITDKIFGELEYHNIWEKKIMVSLWEKDVETTLFIEGEEDGVFEEEQYSAYQSFMKSWDTIKETLADAILDYYDDLRYDLGYDEFEDERYPEIETTDEIIQRVQLTGIVVSFAGIHEGREIGLTFQCSWDKENGIGIRLLNEEIDEIGYSHIAL